MIAAITAYVRLFDHVLARHTSADSVKRIVHLYAAVSVDAGSEASRLVTICACLFVHVVAREMRKLRNDVLRDLVSGCAANGVRLRHVHLIGRQIDSCLKKS